MGLPQVGDQRVDSVGHLGVAGERVQVGDDPVLEPSGKFVPVWCPWRALRLTSG